MTAEMHDKTVLVTGAASGIGAACAIEFSAKGANVILADRSDMSSVLEVIASQGNTAFSVNCDVSDENSVLHLFEQIATTGNSLDVAVNAAGILTEKKLIDMSLAEFDTIVSVNLRGTFLIGRSAITTMLANTDLTDNQHTGRMINIASELAYLGRADFSAYCATKAGVIGLTRSWAREYAPGILVNAIAPGPIDTPMLALENMSPEWREKENDVPLGRVGRPEEIASVALFLAGSGASYMTGQTISPNGGAVMF